MGRRLNFDQGIATFRPHQPDQRSSEAMASLRLVLAGLCFSVVSGCGAPAPPPAELSGLWSTGQASCDAGIGVRFGVDAIEAVYDDERQTLFEHPRYQTEQADGAFRVRITYALPRLAGGARSAGAHGVVVLARHGEGLAPERHNLFYGQTGAALVRIEDDSAMATLTLVPCGAHPWREQLRGRIANA
jgi:hypothetical protein